LTEDGYQTNPPDRFLGTSFAKQAAYVGQAALRVWEQPGVTILIHFLVRDEPSLGGWQSGLFTVHGSAKPSYRAWGLPLSERSRRGIRTVLWGEVRPGAGRRPYALQRLVGGRWVTVGGVRRTGPGGAFERTIALPPAVRVRLSSPLAGYVSPTLTIS